MGFARTVTHYWGDDHFLGEGNEGAHGVVLRDAHLLKNIPGTLVQGSLDPSNLLGTVWRLHHAWPGSELILVDEVGHNAGSAGHGGRAGGGDGQVCRPWLSPLSAWSCGLDQLGCEVGFFSADPSGTRSVGDRRQRRRGACTSRDAEMIPTTGPNDRA